MTNPADMASGGGHPRRRARLRKEAQALAEEVALAEEDDEFVPTVDDIRSGRRRHPRGPIFVGVVPRPLRPCRLCLPLRILLLPGTVRRFPSPLPPLLRLSPPMCARVVRIAGGLAVWCGQVL